jgi:hypothetical protein
MRGDHGWRREFWEDVQNFGRSAEITQGACGFPGIDGAVPVPFTDADLAQAFWRR